MGQFDPILSTAEDNRIADCRCSDSSAIARLAVPTAWAHRIVHQAQPGQSFHTVKDRSETSTTNLAGNPWQSRPCGSGKAPWTIGVDKLLIPGPRPPGQPATRSFAAAPSRFPQRGDFELVATVLVLILIPTSFWTPRRASTHLAVRTIRSLCLTECTLFRFIASIASAYGIVALQRRRWKRPLFRNWLLDKADEKDTQRP